MSAFLTISSARVVDWPAQGDSDTGGHDHFMPLEQEGSPQAFEDPVGEVQNDLRGFDVVDEADELVSPDPGDGICLAQTALQPAGDCDQELIPDLVTQAIVDVFEAVDVEEKDAEPRIRPSLRPCDGLAQPVQEECAVGKTGQGVVERVVLQAVLGRLSLGDVGLGAAIRTAFPWSFRTARPRVRTQR